ncbi:MAG: COG2363, partial [uncultured Campylobacterales bacterium]
MCTKKDSNKSYKVFLATATALMLLGVILGAFGAHGLKDILEPKIFNAYQTGITYHFYHTIGLFIVLIFAKLFVYNKLIISIIYTLLFGILLFSGSLYLYSITSIKIFAMITPIGGLLFIVAW